MINIKGNKITNTLKNKKELLNKKLKAFFIHLLSSVTFIATFILLVCYLWFPDETIKLTGIGKVFITLAAIDITIGPLLTYIVYHPGKKSLKFDLSTIVAMQLMAFSYGAYTVYQAHPVYITYTVDRFNLVPARDADPDSAVFDEYKVSKFGKPILAYAQSPSDPDKKNELLMSVVLQGALDLDARAEYYQPYDKNLTHIIQKSLDPDLLFTTQTERHYLSQFLKKHELEALAFLPIQGKANSMIYVLEKSTGLPLGMIDIDPWEKPSYVQTKVPAQEGDGNV